MKYLNVLPPLALGQKRSLQYRDPERMSAELARGTSAVMNYISDEPDGSFFAQSSFIKTRNLSLVASVSSAFRVEARGASSGILMVASHGVTSTRRGGRTIDWGKGKSALFLPPGGCTARSSGRSVVGIEIDPAVISAITQTMLGGRAVRRRQAFDFATPAGLPLQGNSLDFGSLILGTISMLDHFGGNTHLIERSGIDDAILRMVAVLLNFEELSADETGGRPHRAVVQLACEYIDANLTNTITLTELETITGLSRRSLQYAFRDAFDCTPMQWIALRRLEAVRKHILAARHGATLTTIVGEYFANLGEFARVYKQRYGELPSTTLKNALSKRLRS